MSIQTEMEPHTRIVRWYECGCREIEDNDSIQTTSPATDQSCGDDPMYGGHPHGKLVKEVFQRAQPVPVTNTEWIFGDPDGENATAEATAV